MACSTTVEDAAAGDDFPGTWPKSGAAVRIAPSRPAKPRQSLLDIKTLHHKSARGMDYTAIRSQGIAFRQKSPEWIPVSFDQDERPLRMGAKGPNSHRRQPPSSLSANCSPHQTPLFPLDEPIFLWYSSFWVQLQLIPVLARAHLPLAAKCTIFVQRNPCRCNTSGPPVCVAKQSTCAIFKSFRCNTYKNHRVWGEHYCADPGSRCLRLCAAIQAL